jgi:hypothetical protein
MCFRKGKSNFIALVIILTVSLLIIPFLNGQVNDTFKVPEGEHLQDTCYKTPGQDTMVVVIHYTKIKGPVDVTNKPLGINTGPFDDISLKKSGRSLQTTDVAILYTSGDIAIHRGYENGTFDSLPCDELQDGVGCVDMAIGDVDRDGRLDILVVNSLNNEVILHTGNGDSTFNEGVAIQLNASPAKIELADLNKDGNQDLILTMNDTNQVQIRLGDGSGDFPETFATITLDSLPDAAEIADFNGDGTLDIAVAHGTDGVISVYKGRGNGNFFGQPYFEVTTDGHIIDIAAADLDNDTRTDIVAAYGDDSYFFTVLLNHENGIFDHHAYSVGLNYHSGLALADISGDGRVDIAITSSTRDSVAIITSTFPKNEWPPEKFETYLQKSRPGRDTPYTNWAESIFDSITFKKVNDAMIDIVAGDFNYDNLPDFMTINSDSGRVAILQSVDSSNINSSIEVLYPNGGESWLIGTEQEIQWRKGRGITAVDIQISRNNGLAWEIIAKNLPSNSYAWLVTEPTTDVALMRIRDATVPNRVDTSNAMFSIGGACGNANSDNGISTEDVVWIINYVLLSGYPPKPLESGDVNCDGLIDINDAQWLINYMYSEGDMPCDIDRDGIPDC